MILILGRFQPLHNGHAKVIRDAYSEDKDVVVAIGSSQKKDDKMNPFGAEERKKMIEAWLESERIDVAVVLVPDIPEDEHYVEHCKMYVGRKPDKIITENEWTERLFSEKGYPVERTQRHYGLSSTRIREAMAAGQEWRVNVPDPVVAVLDELDAEKRMKRLFRD